MFSGERRAGYAWRCTIVGRLLSVLVFLDGSMILAGWTLDQPSLAGLGWGVLSSPNTAIALMLAAAACQVAPATGSRWRGNWRSVLTTAFAALVLLIGTARLAELTLAPALNIDSSFVTVFRAPLIDRFPVRMSAAAALGVAFLGVALLALNLVRTARLAQSLALGAVAIGLVVISGYLYEAAALASSPLLAGTAFPTGFGLFAAGLSIVATRPTDGLMRLVTSPDLGGSVVRRTLIPITLAPVLINWIELVGERRGWYTSATGWTIDAVATVGALFAGIWWAATTIQRKDRKERVLETQVSESEERYRTLLESSPDAVIVTNRKRIQEVNHAAVTLLGATHWQDLIGRSPFELIEPSRRDVVESQISTLFDEAGTSIAIESQILRSDGTLVDVALSASAVRVAGSCLVQVLLRDISRRNRQEQAVRESEERFRLIATTISQVFWMADSNIGTMLYVSPAYEDVWGLNCESLYRNPRSFLDAVHPEDRARVLNELKVQQAGLPFDHEYRIVRPDGQIRWIRDRGFPIRQEAEPVRLYVGVAEDVTGRREAAQDLRESLERFELIARATHDATWEFDVRTGVAWWSDSYRQRSGHGADITPSFEAWSADIHPADRERVVAGFSSALNGTGEEWSDEYQYRRADGSFAIVHDRAFIVRDDAGAPLRVAGSLQDVSAQRTVEAQYRQAQKMEAFGQLAGGVAHDFNNILTVISSFAGLLLAGESPDSPRRSDLLAICKAARRASTLTRQLLLFSRREVMEVSRLDVNEAIRKLTGMLTRIIGEDIQIELRLNPEPLLVDGDAGMFDQAILNLAVNARDAMPRGGRLTIESTSEIAPTIPVSRRSNAAPGPHVCVSVSDTGEGIPPEILPRIFEPFFTTKPAGKGTGLGLATVFGIAEQHKGWVDVESRIGKGTTMRVWFPASRFASAPRPAPRHIAQPRGDGQTVLVVENDEGVRESMQAVLSRNDYQVLVAADAIEALAIWRANMATIQLLLTDVVMSSGSSGRELVLHLRADRPALKVLLISGCHPDVAGMQIAADEQSRFLRKPFTPDELLGAVRRALGRSTGKTDLA